MKQLAIKLVIGVADDVTEDEVMGAIVGKAITWVGSVSEIKEGGKDEAN